MESKSIMPENQITREQEIISLYYHNGLTLIDICYRYKYTKKYVAEVLIASTMKKEGDCFTVESIINYVKHF